jgi:Spy/CpxP family protein refolding chaperone
MVVAEVGHGAPIIAGDAPACGEPAPAPAVPDTNCCQCVLRKSRLRAYAFPIVTRFFKEQAMRTRFALAALAAATLSTIAAAQMGPGMGQGRGMGPGMGQPQDCPMMGQGMGPGMGGKGMMHGRGHGMHGGQGMMGGMGQGPGLAALEALDLTAEQRTKITEIRRDAQRKRHALMGSLREIRWQSQDAAKAAELDTAAARKRYDEAAAVRKQMFEAQLEARAKAEAVLTKEQREQLRAQPRPMPMRSRQG